MRISKYMCGHAVAACVALFVVGPASAADHKNVFSEQARMIEGGRNAQILVAQAEIKSNINQSNIVVATGGGLLGALIDAGVNADRAKKAEVAIQPVRAALTGFDVDALAVETTKASLEQVAWLQADGAKAGFGRDTSIVGLNSLLDASPANQVIFVEYVYDTSPDFSSIRVSMNVRVANKAILAGKKPETRLQPRQLAYSQTITSVVSLASPSKEASENATRWSANDGKLARQALTAGFQDVGSLLPRAIAIQEADLKAMNAREKKYAVVGGYGGRIQEDGPSGTLLFNGALVHVQTLAE